MHYTSRVMDALTRYLKSIVTALGLTVGLSMPALAQSEVAPAAPLAGQTDAPTTGQPAPLDELYKKLSDPANPQWELTLSDVLRAWSKSGSPAMDLLLKRGQEAMEAGQFDIAIGHLTALTDHAPEFAEGWNARATAYYLAGQFGPSVADIQHTLALNPNHFGALGGLGMILEETGRPEAALKAYQASLAIHPHQDGIKAAIERIERDTAGTEL
jgi:tetratricopeptide (TPR) repeat protein